MRARVIAAVAVAAVAFSPAQRAWAAERGAGGGAFVNPEGDPTAFAGDRPDSSGGGAGSGGSGSAAPDPCHWAVIIEDDFVFPVYDLVDPSTRRYSTTGRWVEHRCPGRGAVEVGGYPLAPEGGVVVDPAQLAVDALSSVAISTPTVRTSPANGRLYVQVPTWLWLEPGWWQPYEATATAGRVSSTVRATPVRSTWDLGDGNYVSCAGPGTAWRPGVSESASDCTHTYRTSSAGQPGARFELEATVTFEVTWSSNATVGGTLPTITRTSTMVVEVGEIQAIGTRSAQ